MSSQPQSQSTELTKRLMCLLQDQRLERYLDQVEKLAQELSVEPRKIAAAFLMDYLATHPIQQSSSTPQTNVSLRCVRYRLAVGKQHQICEQTLLDLLVEESGVERKRITYLDIRDHYTLVDLPDGMPADIFQLLSEAKLGPHPLNIKRVKPNRRNRTKSHPTRRPHTLD